MTVAKVLRCPLQHKVTLTELFSAIKRMENRLSQYLKNHHRLLSTLLYQLGIFLGLETCDAAKDDKFAEHSFMRSPHEKLRLRFCMTKEASFC